MTRGHRSGTDCLGDTVYFCIRDLVQGRCANALLDLRPVLAELAVPPRWKAEPTLDPEDRDIGGPLPPREVAEAETWAPPLGQSSAMQGASFAETFAWGARRRLRWGDAAERQARLEELNAKGLSQVEADKRRVKEELRAFDAEHARVFGRLPTKAEKEPMRPCYECYQSVKLIIRRKAAAEFPSRTASPQERPNDSGQQQQYEKRLASMKRQLTRLRGELLKFRTEFEEAHGRKVMYHGDITPVYDECKAYKQLKFRIAKLEERTGRGPAPGG